jgi:hypothetical protein
MRVCLRRFSTGRPSSKRTKPQETAGTIDNASNAGGGAFFDGTLDRSSGLDTGSVFGNQFGARVNRGLSDFDRTHSLAMSWAWKLPNASWMTNSRAIHVLFSNWQLSGIVIAMSGLPIDIFDPAAGDLYGLVGARPNWAPGASRKSATTNVPYGYDFNMPLSFPWSNRTMPSPACTIQLRWLQTVGTTSEAWAAMCCAARRRATLISQSPSVFL